MRNSFISILMFTAILLMGCKQAEPKYIIGVSQCSEDIWRDWQNAEMRMEANFHEGVELRFTAAHDDSELQSSQIDSLVERYQSADCGSQPALVGVACYRPCLR